MYVVLFEARTRDGVDLAEYEAEFGRMLEAVSTEPGFVHLKGFAGEDGSELAVVVFDSLEAIDRWRRNPVHVEAQEHGRQLYFESYGITVASVVRQYAWSRDDGRSVIVPAASDGERTS